MSVPFQSQMSRHAVVRCQQRGIPQVLIEQLMGLYDVEHEIGGGCRVLRISHQAIGSQSEGLPGAQQQERLEHLAVIWSDTQNQVVTAFRDRGGRKTRRYRGRG